MEEYEQLNYKQIYILGVIIGIIMITVTCIAYKYENRNLPKDIYYLICEDGRKVIINLSLPEQYGCDITQRFEYGEYIDVSNYRNDYQFDISNGLFNIS